MSSGVSSGLSIGRCDAAWRPTAESVHSHPDGHESDLGLDELIKTCGRMRVQLQELDDPRQQVAVLRRMARHRAAIARLDRRRGTQNGGPGPVGAVGDPNGPNAGGETAGEAPLGGHGDTAAAMSEGDPAVEPDETPGESEADDPLTLRYLIEGPPQAGTTTIIELLSTHFETDLSSAAVTDDGLTVHWLEFSAGSFEGRPIRFEVCSVSGPAYRSTRRYIRSLVDAIILVVEATPAGLGAGAGRLAEINVDRMGRNEHDRPDLTVFAHKVDLTNAFDPARVALLLGVDEATRIVATTRERGSTHGLAQATSSALRRLQRRDAANRPRTVGLARSGFLTLVRGGLPARMTTDIEPPVTLPRWSAPSVDARAATEIDLEIETGPAIEVEPAIEPGPATGAAVTQIPEPARQPPAAATDTVLPPPPPPAPPSAPSSEAVPSEGVPPAVAAPEVAAPQSDAASQRSSLRRSALRRLLGALRN